METEPLHAFSNTSAVDISIYHAISIYCVILEYVTRYIHTIEFTTGIYDSDMASLNYHCDTFL